MSRGRFCEAHILLSQLFFLSFYIFILFDCFVVGAQNTLCKFNYINNSKLTVRAIFGTLRPGLIDVNLIHSDQKFINANPVIWVPCYLG